MVAGLAGCETERAFRFEHVFEDDSSQAAVFAEVCAAWRDETPLAEWAALKPRVAIDSSLAGNCGRRGGKVCSARRGGTCLQSGVQLTWTGFREQSGRSASDQLGRRDGGGSESAVE